MNQIKNTETAITQATVNIKRAERMGLKRFAQDIRRERRAMQERLVDLKEQAA